MVTDNTFFGTEPIGRILLLIPLAWAFSLLGLRYVWLAFPITEYAAAAASYFLYRKYPLKELKYAD